MVNTAYRIYDYLIDKRIDLALKEVRTIPRPDYRTIIKPILKDLLAKNKDRMTYQLFNLLNIEVSNVTDNDEYKLDYDEYKLDYELFKIANKVGMMACLKDRSHTIKEIDNAIENCDVIKIELEKLKEELNK